MVYQSLSFFLKKIKREKHGASGATMGRRNQVLQVVVSALQSFGTVKKSSRQVIERNYSRMTLDFHTNKKIIEEVSIIPSKRLRNKIAGFSTHLMKRIQRGLVRGISLKLQEEERERRMDFVSDESAIKVDQIEVDKETLDMLLVLGMVDIPGLVKVDPVDVVPQIGFGRGGGPGRRF
ncbi:40S ribosomal protein S17-1 [Hibiscus syriacus]|uniref:40S ribosomal protein S17-1 n=1 Tax=Hibiscus syriacus TaxID=106335 RepID=A0A6A2XXV1_HIBSY|nr:40S ribosomal protein S17-like [Hibiscus syriacus]KAE8675060.1 40S ribosomal protein S17-1 [Hibiscus syriacus]